MNERFLEEDLYHPVRNYLQERGFEIRSEVGYCDVAAIKDGQLVVIELKKNLTVELLAQAVKRQKIADLVYMAVPKPKRLKANSKWKDLLHLIRRLELGLMLVSFKGQHSFIEIAADPQPFDFAKSKQSHRKNRDQVIQEMKGRNRDFNVGGSKGKKLITAYKEKAIHIAVCLELFGPLSTRKLREMGTDTKKTSDILLQNYYSWFFKVQKGVYGLTSEGKEALSAYRELADFYRTQINNHYTMPEDEKCKES